MMNSPTNREMNVHIGEVKVAKNGEILKAILGSCVGVGFIWKGKGMCGLAHCLLPESPQKAFSIGGRFVDQAVASLISLMKIRPEFRSQIEVVVAGGGNMTNPEALNDDKLVGSHNFRAAEQEIKKYGLNVSYARRGGQEGMRIIIDSSNCTFVVEKIPRIIQ